VLHTTQHRLREKTFLSQNGFPVTPYAPIANLDDLRAAVTKLGLPSILKSAGFGYDGKGQFKITSADQIEQAWATVTAHSRSESSEPSSPTASGQPVAVLEAFVRFEREVSVVAARGMDGTFAHWGVVENDHRDHILDLSLAPAFLDAKIHHEAIAIARGVLEALDVVGILCVEFFIAADGRILINELAPRPHNSGHLTIDASVTSQFEQQLRAVCGLPLGNTSLHSPAAMAQLLGDVWLDAGKGGPNWRAALADPSVKLHLYGKAEPRKGRKMGHLTALAPTAEEARLRVLAAREALTQPQ